MFRTIVNKTGFSQRGIGSNLLITLGVLCVLFIVGMAFLNFLQGEQRLTRSLYHHEKMVYIAEAALEEAAWYVRKSMNTEGETWYDHLRNPGTASSAGETYDPTYTRDIAELAFSSSFSLDVKISLHKAAPFMDDPAPDPIEKTAVLKFVSTVKTGRRRKSIQALKQIKVVRLSPPSPLADHSLWLWDKGQLSWNDSVTPGLPPALDPLDEDARQAMNDTWRYTWYGANKRRFPLCAQKFSYFFNSVEEFKKQFSGSDGFTLCGQMMIETSNPASRLILKGAVDGRGWLITRGVRVGVGYCETAPEALFGLAMLNNSPLPIRGFGNRLFEGMLMLPYGTLVTDSNLSIKGQVYARNWEIASENSLEFDQDRLRQPVYHATMSDQVMAWGPWKE